MKEDTKYSWWQVCTPWESVSYGRFKPNPKKIINSRLKGDPFGNWRYTLAIF